MRSYTEVNYCIYIKDGKDKFYRFDKISIINNDPSWEPCHEPIKSEKVYDIFFMLYPILKEVNRKYIQIQRAWESWHPLNEKDKFPINEYKKERDRILTNSFLEWFESRKPEFKGVLMPKVNRIFV